MAIVIVEQFNPVSRRWNTLYEIDESEFVVNGPFKMDRYGGPYRGRIGSKIIKEVVKPEVPEILGVEVAFDTEPLVKKKSFFQKFGDESD